MSLLATYFRVFQWRLSAAYMLAPRAACPVGLALSPAMQMGNRRNHCQVTQLRLSVFSYIGYQLTNSVTQDENRALLGRYAAISGNFLPTFRHKLSLPSSRVNLFRGGSLKSCSIKYLSRRFVMRASVFCNIFQCPAVDCVWNAMAHAQKQDFFFRRNGRAHLKSAGRGVSSVDYWQPRCAHQR